MVDSGNSEPTRTSDTPRLPKSLKVLALEPYYGGSHRAFLDTWVGGSRHAWTLLTLPPRHWKWRMRGSAMWFAEQLRDAPAGEYDVLFTCDMTAVADLRALLSKHLRTLPIVCYFHENQLTYPLSPDDWRDYQYAFTNITSALAADAVWFNSQAHQDAFFDAVRALLRKMPGYTSLDAIDRLERRCEVHYPPVQVPNSLDTQDGTAPSISPDLRKPLRILWSHRWEYDKAPEAFFDVIQRLDTSGADFQLVIVGEQFRTAPEAFQHAVQKLSHRIAHQGYLPDRTAYEQMIASCDVIVSTAIQENFGIAVVEAMLAGCLPLLPNRLSYPELIPDAFTDTVLYATEDQLLERLSTMCRDDRRQLPKDSRVLRQAVTERFGMQYQVPRLDDAIAQINQLQINHVH